MFYLSVRLVGGPQAIVYLLGCGLFCLWDSDRLHEESFFVCIGFQGIKPASPRYIRLPIICHVLNCEKFFRVKVFITLVDWLLLGLLLCAKIVFTRFVHFFILFR